MTERNQSQENLEEKAKEEFEICPKIADNRYTGHHLTSCLERGIACKEKTEHTVLVDGGEYEKCLLWYK